MKKSLLIRLIILFVTALSLSGCIVWPFWWDDGGGHHDSGWHGGHGGHGGHRGDWDR